MTPKKLILVDALLSFPLKLIALIFVFLNSLRNRNSSTRVLVVKFLGAGNFIPISEIINHSNFDIVTVKANQKTLQKFAEKASTLLLDEKSFLTVLYSSVILIFRLFGRKYTKVLNLESESTFAKFICSIPGANKRLGISNKHKSFFDSIFYSSYLVNANLASKADVLRILLDYSEIKNLEIDKLVSIHNNKFVKKYSKECFSHVALAVTCSKTDNNRRVNAYLWSVILEAFEKNVSIKILFDNEKDPQYKDFINLTKSMKNAEVVLTDYDNFVDLIKQSDLVISLDSQALHVAQKFQRPTIAFYGPTSPYGVNFNESTYAVSKSLLCSPCVHKYHKLPCRGKSGCMNFEKEEIISLIGHLKSCK